MWGVKGREESREEGERAGEGGGGWGVKRKRGRTDANVCRDGGRGGEGGEGSGREGGGGGRGGVNKSVGGGAERRNEEGVLGIICSALGGTWVDVCA